jgi:hypothetical protein
MTIPFFQGVLTAATAASLYLILPFIQDFQNLPDSIHRNISHINQNPYNRDLARWCPTGYWTWSHRRRIRRTPPALALCIKPRSPLHK